MARRLRLSKETLAEIGARELSQVNGGTHLCDLTDPCTHGPSLEQACPTLPVLICLRDTTLCVQTA